MAKAKEPLAISLLFLAPPTPFSYLHDNKAFSQHAVKRGGLSDGYAAHFPHTSVLIPCFDQMPKKVKMATTKQNKKAKKHKNRELEID
jgi:hypothetical protein